MRGLEQNTLGTQRPAGPDGAFWNSPVILPITYGPASLSGSLGRMRALQS